MRLGPRTAQELRDEAETAAFVNAFMPKPVEPPPPPLEAVYRAFSGLSDEEWCVLAHEIRRRRFIRIMDDVQMVSLLREWMKRHVRDQAQDPPF